MTHPEPNPPDLGDLAMALLDASEEISRAMDVARSLEAVPRYRDTLGPNLMRLVGTLLMLASQTLTAADPALNAAIAREWAAAHGDGAPCPDHEPDTPDRACRRHLRLDADGAGW